MAVVNIGTAPNDGTGDALRDAFDKVNKEFEKTILKDGSVDFTSSVNIQGSDGTPEEGFKVLKSDGTVLGYVGEDSSDEHSFGIYGFADGHKTKIQTSASGSLFFGTSSVRTCAFITKEVTVNGKKVLTEADLPTMPTADGEYKLKVASGVATWVSI